MNVVQLTEGTGTGKPRVSGMVLYAPYIAQPFHLKRSSGYGYASGTELTEVPGRCACTNVVLVPVPVTAPGYV